MEKFCIFCGKPLEKGACSNPECPVNEEIRQENDATIRRKPISLRERRRQIYGAEEKAPEETEEETTKYTDPRKVIGIFPYDPEAEDDTETNEIAGQEETDKITTSPKPSEVGKTPVATSPVASNGEEKKTAISPKKEKMPTTERKDAPPQREGGLKNLSLFLSDYFTEPGKVVAAAARKRDVGIGTTMMVVSVILSALGTLFFGSVYLEDFFGRWIVCGILTPVLAYGLSLLFGSLFAILSPLGRARRQSEEGEKLPFGELFATVVASSVLPNLLLLLSGLIAPMDRNLEIFQFFALLLTVSWVVCLIFSLFTVYGGGFSLGGLLLMIGFGLLAFLVMRALWVWYLTGEFAFSLYIPLSIFLS